MENNLSELLFKLRKRDLLSSADSKGLKIPEDSTKEQLIDILKDTFPGELEDLLRNAVRLELETTESNLRNVIENKLSDLKKDNIEFSKKLEGVTTIKFVFSIIASAIILITGVGSVLGILQFKDLKKNIDDAKEQIEFAKATNEGLKTAFGIYRDYAVNQQISLINSLMENFSHNFPNEKDFENVLMHKSDLKRLVDISKKLNKSEPSSGERDLEVVYNFIEGLDSIKGLKSIADKQLLKVKLNSAIFKLKDFEKKTDMIEQAKLFNSYYSNIVGVLYYSLYGLTEDDEDLEHSKVSYENSYNIDPTYARVYQTSPCI
jgi:hypothetical protein